MADANHWGGGPLMAPHCKSGPFQRDGATFTRALGGALTDPTKVGAAGGNVGFLDGSVRWVNINEMKRRFASSYPLYYGFW
jgi:prepilin-type processing-associated H-X9-DG protein